MSEAQRIAKQLQRTFQGRAFHGPALNEVLVGVSSRIAQRIPPGASHSIWQTVLHVAFWQDEVCRWLGGQYRPPAELNDWPAVESTSEDAWQAALEALRSSNAALCAVATKLDDARLSGRVHEGAHSVYVTLHGIVQHNVYHAGQIALLKKLLDQP